MSSCSCLELHPKVCLETSNSQLLCFLDSTELFIRTSLVHSVFTSQHPHIPINTRLRMGLRYHLFLAHSHLQDVAYARHRVIFASCSELSSFWTIMPRARFYAHHPRWALKSSFIVHLVLELVVKCMYLPLRGNLSFSDLLTAIDCPCW